MRKGVTVFLGVDSAAVSSAQLASILALGPDESWDAGSSTLIGSTMMRRRFNHWAIVESVLPVEDPADAVDRLFRRLAPIEDNFSRLPPGTGVYFAVTLTTQDSLFGFGLTADQLRFCASLGAGLEMSFAVVPPTPGDAPATTTDIDPDQSR